MSLLLLFQGIAVQDFGKSASITVVISGVSPSSAVVLSGASASLTVSFGGSTASSALSFVGMTASNIGAEVDLIINLAGDFLAVDILGNILMVSPTTGGMSFVGSTPSVIV